MAVVDRLAYGRSWLLVVDADPNGVLTASSAGGDRAILNATPWTEWRNLGGTVWCEVDYRNELGFSDDDTAVKVANWTDMATSVPVAGVVASGFGLIGTPRHRRIAWTPTVDAAAARVTGVSAAVAAGEWLYGVRVAIVWNMPGDQAITAATDFKIALMFCLSDGTLARGCGWTIDNGAPGTAGGGTVRLEGFSRTGAGTPIVSAWTKSTYRLYGGPAILHSHLWILRQADNTILVYGGRDGSPPARLYSTALAAAAGAGFLSVCCYANLGITQSAVPTVQVSSQLLAATAATKPWVV